MRLSRILGIAFFVTIGFCTTSLISSYSTVNQELIDYRGEMRNFVIKISNYAKKKNSKFIIIPQNGIELVTQNGQVDGPLSTNYLEAIDGHGQEGLNFGYDTNNKSTPRSIKKETTNFLNVSKNTGNVILVTDYCSSQNKIAQSNSSNAKAHFKSYAAIDKDLKVIPFGNSPIQNENTSSIKKLSDVQNYLYLTNFNNFSTKKALLNTIASTNYDLVLIDLFYDNAAFTKKEIELLKEKANGGKRLVIGYMPIAEVKKSNYYWDNKWEKEKPIWLVRNNVKEVDKYIVNYWNSDWQNLILGSKKAYLDMLMETGFDGAYLDLNEGYKYFEKAK